MFFKLLLAGLVAGAGAYYYDLKKAPTVIKDAKYSSIETESRCRQNHESLCKYYLTVKLEAEKLFYKFQVPYSYYHRMNREDLKKQRFTVVVKQEKIFPERILDVHPKMRTVLDEALENEP